MGIVLLFAPEKEPGKVFKMKATQTFKVSFLELRKLIFKLEASGGFAERGRIP